MQSFMQELVDEHIADDDATRLETIREPRRRQLFQLYKRSSLVPDCLYPIMDFGCLQTVQEIVNSSRAIDLLPDGDFLGIALELGDLPSHRLRCLLVKAADAEEGGVTAKNLRHDDLHVLLKMLDGVEGGFRFVDFDGKASFLLPTKALQKLASMPRQRPGYYAAGNLMHYSLFKTSFMDRIKAFCDSAFDYHWGDASFLVRLRDRHGDDCVREAVAGNKDLDSGTFSCPACPDRPNRRLANPASVLIRRTIPASRRQVC